jgi:hypothetical protein
MGQHPALPVDDDQRGRLRLSTGERQHPRRQLASVSADHTVSQSILHYPGDQAGQRQIPLGHKVAHRPLVGVDAREGQGDEDERDRQHRPQKELGVQTAEPTTQGQPPIQ